MGAAKRKHIYKPNLTVGPDGTPQSSIYRGVSLHKGTMKYRATIKIKGAKIALGSYDDEIEAAKAFDRAALRYRGNKAEINFPQECRPPAKRQKTEEDRKEKKERKEREKADVAPREGLRSKASKTFFKDEPLEEGCLPIGPNSAHASNELQIEVQPPALKRIYSPFVVAASQTNARLDEVDSDLVAEALAGVEGLDDLPREQSYGHSDTGDSRIPSGGQQEFAASDVPNVPTSHGLSVLQSRFQLYRFDSSATSTSARASQLDDLEMLTSQPSRPLGSMHSRQRSSRVDNFDNQCSDFRQMLMSRAYADCSRDSDMSQASSRAHWNDWTAHRQTAPVNFSEQDQGDQRKAWWKLQLQLSQEQEFLRNLP